jgi:hypothetical protein
VATWALAFALVLSVAPAARALTLADLQAGGSFMALSDPLSFDNFSITVSGALSADLSDYTVVVLEDGFSIVGPMGVASSTGGIDLAFDVLIKTDVAPESSLTGASLFFNGAAAGPGSLASVAEELIAPGLGSIGSLLVLVDGNSSDYFDETTWDAPDVVELHVRKLIRVQGGDATAPGIGTISLITERFDVDNPPVSEPVAATMLGFGLMGLWRFGRRPAAR